MTSRNNPHWGSTLDDLLRGDGIRDAARAEAATRVTTCWPTPGRPGRCMMSGRNDETTSLRHYDNDPG